MIPASRERVEGSWPRRMERFRRTYSLLSVFDKRIDCEMGCIRDKALRRIFNLVLYQSIEELFDKA